MIGRIFKPAHTLTVMAMRLWMPPPMPLSPLCRPTGEPTVDAATEEPTVKLGRYAYTVVDTEEKRQKSSESVTTGTAGELKIRV